MITWVVMYRAWPITKCGVVGCKEPRAFDKGHNGLLRRWCEGHAVRWDLEAGLEGGKLIEVNFGALPE